MALQKPVDPPFKLTKEQNLKFTTAIYCCIYFIVFGIYLGFQTPSFFADKHNWITVSVVCGQSLCCLTALYGVVATRPTWMLPLLVVIATYTGFFVERTRKSVVAAIENVIFGADDNYRFNDNGYWLQLLHNFLWSCLCCYYFCYYWRTFKVVRAEKKASESLPLHQSFLDDSDKKPILQDV